MVSRDDAYAPLAREPKLADRATQQLQSLITRRTFQPGDRLPSERELGVRLGVSRTVDPRGASRPLDEGAGGGARRGGRVRQDPLDRSGLRVARHLRLAYGNGRRDVRAHPRDASYSGNRDVRVSRRNAAGPTTWRSWSGCSLSWRNRGAPGNAGPSSITISTIGWRWPPRIRSSPSCCGPSPRSLCAPDCLGCGCRTIKRRHCTITGMSTRLSGPALPRRPVVPWPATCARPSTRCAASWRRRPQRYGSRRAAPRKGPAPRRWRLDPRGDARDSHASEGAHEHPDPIPRPRHLPD